MNWEDCHKCDCIHFLYKKTICNKKCVGYVSTQIKEQKFMEEDKVDVKEVEKYLLAQRNGSMICKSCGIINAVCGYYPLFATCGGGDIIEISMTICLDCDKKLREF